jgi:hypothetical protein
MRAEPAANADTADTIVFKCRPAENPTIAKEDHMREVTFTFIDCSHVKAEWILAGADKRESRSSFTFTRKT